MTFDRLIPRTRVGWLLAAVLSLGVGLAIADHWNHVLGILPYLLILACPLMHVFMHGGHGGHQHAGAEHHSQHRRPGSAMPIVSGEHGSHGSRAPVGSDHA